MGIGYKFGINFISGTLGSCMVLAFIYPFNFCRQSLANDVKGNRNIITYSVKIIKPKGLEKSRNDASTYS